MVFKIKILMVMLIPLTITSQSVPEFSPGRPGMSETSNVIHKGFYQIEIGLNKSLERSGNFLFRTGIFDGFEIRLALDHSFDNNFSTQGLTGGSLFQIFDQDGLIPQVALLTTLTFPDLDNVSIQTGKLTIIGSFSHSLSDKYSFDWNLGTIFYGSEKNPNDIIYTSAIGYGLSKKIGIFVELYGVSPLFEFSRLNPALDYGITYLLLDWIQMDISSGYGLINNSDSRFFDIGLAFRVP